MIDLAAGRSPDVESLTSELVDSAIEHRMEGLLYSWATAENRLGSDAGNTLAATETRNWARNELLATHAVRLEADAAAHGVEICFMKGVVLESQIYSRRGERPTSDLDVIVRGGSTRDISAWVESLQPRHRWIPQLETLISGGHIQAIDLSVAGVQVDLHFDPLKLEIVGSRAASDLLARVVKRDIGVGTVTGLDAEASLVLALLHLNKDRFRRLIGFADAQRLVDRVRDWDWIIDYARAERLTTPLLASLDVVSNSLGTAPHRVSSGSTVDRRLWNRVWPERTRLLGYQGAVRYRYRQMLIPLFDPRRWREAMVGAGRRLFPPRPLVGAFFPERRGGYLTTLLVGRIALRLERARRRRAVGDATR